MLLLDYNKGSGILFLLYIYQGIDSLISISNSIIILCERTL